MAFAAFRVRLAPHALRSDEMVLVTGQCSPITVHCFSLKEEEIEGEQGFLSGKGLIKE